MQHVTLTGCAYLGGCNYPIAVGDSAALCFGEIELLVQLDDGTSFTLPYIELAGMDISGPGTLTSGGGFTGGGFGVAGALEGMAVAGILNALTTKSKIHTFVGLTTNIGELHFHYGQMEPSALRIALASVYTTLRRLDPVWQQGRVAALQLAKSYGVLAEPEVERLMQRLTLPTVEVSVPPPADPRSIPSHPVVGPKGRCPNCGAIISLQAEECFSCKAMFGHGAAWKVIPLQ